MAPQDAKDRAAQRHRNLLAQEYREMRSRVNMGGVFYPCAVFLAFLSSGGLRTDLTLALGLTLPFVVLAVLRFRVPLHADPEPQVSLRGIRYM